MGRAALGTFAVAGATLALLVPPSPRSDSRPPVTIAVGSSPMSLVVGAGAIWVANKGDGSVSRIDPASDRVVASIQVGGQPWGLAFDGASIWVGNYERGSVARIDPATNA